MQTLNKVYLVGGSIPEREGDRLFNTSTVWSPEGRMIARHRKIHLFDIDVPGKITFKESDALTAGDDFTTFETPFATVGLGICYDIRFADLAQGGNSIDSGHFLGRFLGHFLGRQFNSEFCSIVRADFRSDFG